VKVVDLRHAAARHQFAGGFAHHLQTGDQGEQGQALERGLGVGKLRGSECVIAQEGIILQRQHLGDLHHDAGLFFEDRGVGEHREIGTEIKAALIGDHRHGFARLLGGGARRGEEFAGRGEQSERGQPGGETQVVLGARHDRERAVEVKRAAAAVAVEHGEVELHPLRGQQAEGMVELDQSGTVDAVDGYGLMRVVLEGFVDGIGHVAARAEFDKDAEAVFMHLSDRVVKKDR